MVSIVAVWENGAELLFCSNKQKHKGHSVPYKVTRQDHQTFSVTFYCKGLCSSKKPGQMKIIANILTKEKNVVSLQSCNFFLRGNFRLCYFIFVNFLVRRTKNDFNETGARRRKRYDDMFVFKFFLRYEIDFSTNLLRSHFPLVMSDSNDCSHPPPITTFSKDQSTLFGEDDGPFNWATHYDRSNLFSLELNEWDNAAESLFKAVVVYIIKNS